MRPDFETEPEPTVGVATQVTCPQCGYVILTMARDLTEGEIRLGLDRTISDLRATIDRLMAHPAIRNQPTAEGPERLTPIPPLEATEDVTPR